MPRLGRRPRTQAGNFQRVKLLFDENLSPLLPNRLKDFYPASLHVHDCGLSTSDDLAIWTYAKHNGLMIVSKDSDFQELSVLHGHPPKFVWLRVPNCSVEEIESLLRSALPAIEHFAQEQQESCLILALRPKP